MLKINHFNGLNILITQKEDGNLRGKQLAIPFLKKQNIKKNIQHLTLMNGSKRIFSQNYSQKNDQADAIITNLKQNPDISLSFVTGDCFPLIAYDPKTGCLALIHAGWMPLVQNIIELTILDMKMEFKSQITDIKFWIGPGIRKCCYKSTQLPSQLGMPEWDKIIEKVDNCEWTIDLNVFIKNELVRLGATATQITDMGKCSYCSKDENGNYEYFSYKRAKDNQEKQQRFMTAVWRE
jgi:copper oxidase (laccase) domain-containing protein